MKRKIVITGLGAITALGEGAPVLWEAALRGRSGIDRLDFSGDGSPEWRPAGGCFKEFSPEKYVTQRKSLKVMARDIQLAVAAAKLALADAGLDGPGTDPERSGVIAGSGVLNHELNELAPSVYASMDDPEHVDLEKFGQTGIPSIFPLWLLKYLPNMPACHISVLFNFQGVNNTVTGGASSGLQAAGEAFRVIERGDADIMLAGGAESRINPMGLSYYALLGLLSGAQTPDVDPKKIYKPFDAVPGGLIIGEGAGFLVFEEREHAEKRHARIYAEVAGFGSSDENGHDLAMEAALKEAGMAPGQALYVQAAGLGINREDAREAEAIARVFGAHTKTLSVTGSKPLTGFCGFAAGALDLILSTLAIAGQKVPALLNFEKPAKDWGFRVVAGTPVNQTLDGAMTNAFGMGAPSASMVTKRYRGN